VKHRKIRTLSERIQCHHCSGLGYRDEVPGARLRELRERSCKSLSFLAKIAGVSVPYLSDVERGNRRCTERIIQLYETLESGDAKGA